MMSSPSTHLEARLNVQERTTAMLSVRVEELSLDMAASFRQQAEYQIAFERRIDARFNAIEKEIVILKGDVAVLKEDVATLKKDVATLKKDVASLKEEVASLRGEMSAMEGRILDAFKQLVDVVRAQGREAT